jgi:hypothetical protein
MAVLSCLAQPYPHHFNIEIWSGRFSMPSNNSFVTPDRASNITEHMRAESEDRYRTLFDLAPVAVYSLV